MKYKIILFIFLASLAFRNEVQAQKDRSWLYEVGASIGAMNALTDVGGKKGKGTRGVKDYNIKNTHFCGSLYAAAGFKNAIIVRLEGTLGQLSAYDSILEKVKKSSAVGRYSRNLHFRSNIAEISLVAEFHPIYLFELYDEESFFAYLSPYVMGGLAYYHFNPQAQLNSEWVNLQPLHTEGQGFEEFPTRKNYKLNQINFPLGLGFKYELNNNLNLRLEGLFRISQTDYIDDVSTRYIDPALFSKYLSGTNLTQALVLNNRVRAGTPRNETTARPGGIRGRPKNNDHYFTLNLKIGYIFIGDNSTGGWEKRTRQQQRTPTVF